MIRRIIDVNIPSLVSMKNLTLHQNNQKEIIAIKTFLIDQPFYGNDYKLYRTGCLSSSTKISDVTMMGNRVKGAGNGKRETGNGNRERGTGKGKTKNGNKRRELEMKILIGLRFQPRSQGSLSYPSLRTLDEKEREPGNEVAGVQVRFCSRFSFSRSPF